MPTCDELATKAELQELRDQLNAVLGKKEDGSKVNAFVKGQAPVLSAGAMLGTVFVATQERAANAVMDIVLDNPANEPIWRDLANGNAKWSTVKGSGSRGPLPDLSKISKAAGSGASISTVGAKTTAASGAGIGVLANLAAIGTTLALNKATVDVFDQRIAAEAKGAQLQIDAVNSGMLRLYQKNQGDISAANGEIGQLQSALQSQNGTISTLQLDVLNNRLELQDAVSDIDKAATRINILETVSAESKQQIQELENTVAVNNAEAKAAIDSLNLSVIELDNLLEIAKDTIAKQDLIISKLDERIENLETTIEDLAALYGRTDAELQILRFEFDKLQSDIDEDKELADARADLIEAKLIILQHKANNSGGGTSTVVKQNLKDEQNKLLELTSKLTGKPGEFEPIDDIDLDNAANTGESKFKRQFEELLDNITPDNMTPEQIEDLRDNVKNDFKNELGLAIGTLLIPNLVDLKQRTSLEAISQGVEAGICNSLNGAGSCPATPGNPNPVQGLKGMQNKLGDWLGTGNLLQGQNIAGMVSRIDKTVHHGTWGLEKIQGFADTAWKATQADKILAVVNTTLLVHNAMMLSNNLFQTMGEATSIALQAVGIKDHEDNPIDVNTLVKSKLNSMLSSVLGAGNYAALTARIAKANRIYQSSINLLDTTRNLFDSAQTIAEIGTRYTGEIGNALRNAGVVAEDAYEEMVEKINPQSAKIMGFQKFIDGIEVAENAFDSVSQISSNVVEVQENIAQIKTEKQALKTELDTKIDDKKTERTDIKLESETQTELAKIDFAKDESDDS